MQDLIPTLSPALPGPHLDLDGKAGPVRCYVGGPGSPEVEAEGAIEVEADSVPLLLIHSVNAAASAYEVKPLFDHFRATRPVYAIDLPGYGLSDRSDRVYSPRLMTDAVLDAVDVIASKHRGRAIDAIAVSLSCEYLARATVERPAAFRSAGLVSATALDRDRPFDGAPGSTRGKAWLLKALGRAPWSEGLFRQLTRPGVIRFFLEKTWGSKRIDEGLYAYDVATTRQPGASHAPFYFLSAFLFSADITTIYRDVPCPVLLVHGTKGDFTNYKAAGRIVDSSGWTVHVMQTGAMPYFEDLRSFVDAYEAFVRDRVAGQR